jgi:periplasmic protein TonB
MAQPQPAEEHHVEYNPFDGPRRRKIDKGAWATAIIVTLLLWTGLIIYMYNAKFDMKMKMYNDEKLDTELVKPPPPVLQPREVPPPPADITPPPPLPVPPVKREERIEQVAPPVIAKPAPPPPRQAVSVVTSPDWLRKPSGADIDREYPERASRLEKSGTVRLTCKVRANGTLENCNVLSENPRDLGFGDAALKLVPKFQMKPETRDGEPVNGASVTIPITFRLGE